LLARRRRSLEAGSVSLTVRCRTCGFTSSSVEAFPRAKDQLRECPQCRSVEIAGLPGIFKAAERLKQRRKDGAR
jgi:predicted Zn-ribbon and HTH transcriptional regulator